MGYTMLSILIFICGVWTICSRIRVSARKSRSGSSSGKTPQAAGPTSDEERKVTTLVSSQAGNVVSQRKKASMQASAASAPHSATQTTITVPPGALRVTFQENVPKKAQGVFLKDLASDSPLQGKVPVGAFLVSINGIHCALSDLNQIQSTIMSTAQSVRRFTFETREARAEQSFGSKDASSGSKPGTPLLLQRDAVPSEQDHSLQSELGTVSLL
jgi:hypothetical protein